MIGTLDRVLAILICTTSIGAAGCGSPPSLQNGIRYDAGGVTASTHVQGNSAMANGVRVDETTQLIRAIKQKSRQDLFSALANGADPNAKASQEAPVVIAARESDVETLKVLLERGGDPNSISGDNGNSALDAAFTRGVFEGDWDNFYALLDHGADVEQVYRQGTTIAVAAVALGRPSKVLELLDRGYRRDLPRLARMVEGRVISGNEVEVRAKQEVIERIRELTKRGASRE